MKRIVAVVLVVAAIAAVWFVGANPVSAPVYQSEQSSTGSAVTQLVCAVPASTADGDLLIATVTTQNSATHTHTTPSGWTLLHSGETTASVKQRQSVYRRVAASEPADYTFQWSVSSQDAIVTISRITGADTTNPINASAATADVAAAPFNSPSVTTTVADCLILALISHNISATTDTDPSGMTNEFSLTSAGGATTVRSSMARVNQASAGSSGAKTWTLSTDRRSNTATIAIAPPAASGTIAVTTPARYKTWQRNGSNQASLSITGTYTGSPTAIEASFNGGAYATIVASPAGGTFSGTLSNQAAGQGTLTVRFTNDTAVSATALDIGIGDVFLVAGQSNGSGRGTNNQSYSHATLKATMFREDDAWANCTDPTDSGDSAVTPSGSPWPLLATQIMDETGFPVAFITTCDGGTGLVTDNDWDKGGTGGTGNGASYDACVAQVTASGVNAIAAVLWHQGEQDAANGVARATYNAALDQLIVDFQGEGGALASTVLIAAQIGDQIATDAQLDAIRLAQSDAWDDNALIYPGPVLYDVDLSDGGGDGVHFKTDAELLTLANRWWASVSAALWAGGGRGPKRVSAVENVARTEITVTFDATLKTGLTLATGAWAVKDNGTPVTISAVADGPTSLKVVLTLAAALTGTGTITLGSGDNAIGLVVPVGANVSLPVSGVLNLPAEPFVDAAVSAVTGSAFYFRNHVLSRGKA